ncbi:MAG TPA: permease [Haliscomenobacter sp.]|mgnify:CR=1 FL=1|uniref:permease n=1 Tax=Haliscomenobacter sp. TaxID=2717303 RepID=UPI002BCF7305|nr:permease [Haliscomenobacter sp.]HOY16705.1 permease [Haliscomenobacter sp.]HPH17870.1 permease [Haliscomenobacter sp.]
MNIALQKAIALLALIAIGILLKPKIKSKEQADGIKAIILSLALPATIFIALLKTEVRVELISLPILALVFNVLLFGLSHLLLPFMGIARGTPEFRSLLMMIPSLAPGLSCFPILAEYQGDQAVAWAALGDLGNKVFVLIVLYLLAMRWYYRFFPSENVSTAAKVKDLLLTLIREPVNLVIVVAMICLSMGWHLQNLPAFLQDVVLKIGAIMTPLVLLFIGISVQPHWSELRLIGGILFLRAGLTLLISGIFLSLVPNLSPAAAILAVVFPQSAVSFWPFAHIAAVHTLEGDKTGSPKIFNPGLALNFIALSLPFSTLLILSICTIGVPATRPITLGLAGLIMVTLALLPPLLRRVRLPKMEKEVEMMVEN